MRVAEDTLATVSTINSELGTGWGAARGPCSAQAGPRLAKALPGSPLRRAPR